MPSKVWDDITYQFPNFKLERESGGEPTNIVANVITFEM